MLVAGCLEGVNDCGGCDCVVDLELADIERCRLWKERDQGFFGVDLCVSPG